MNYKKFLRKQKYVKKVNHKWSIDREIVCIDGKYMLGPEEKYTLTEEAFVHIINGDYSERLVLDENGIRTGEKETILQGGLHTYKSWIDLKNTRDDIVHLQLFNSKKHKYWYYARSLKNNVITLKIPRELFQNKAANITRYPDTFYKSGYLWKTLFPKDKTKEDILKIIDEALFKLDKEESQEGVLIGYALVDNPFTAIKVRIQCRGYQINSAFPAWEQPRIGNTGKAYSHIDTIGFNIAQSTEFFDDYEESIKNNTTLFTDNNIYLLTINTPEYFLRRPILPEYGNINEWNLKREKDLKSIAKHLEEDDIETLKQYLQDPLISKGSFSFQLEVYNSLYNEFSNNRDLFNAVLIHQNIFEALLIIYFYDQENHSLHLIEMIEFILLSKTTFTGALDCWNNKRLHNKIIDLVLNYHSTDIINVYWKSIIKSPTRSCLFLEFDVFNICYKKKLSQYDELFDIIYASGMDVMIRPEYFYDYLLYMLGENYLIGLQEEKQKELVHEIINSQGPQFHKMVEDCFKLTSSNDLTFLSEKLSLLVQKTIDYNLTSNINANDLNIFIKDYFRVQTANRMKILHRYPDFELDALDVYEFGSEKCKLNTIIKHERRTIVVILENFLDIISSIANQIEDKTLLEQITKYKDNVWTERPPVPKGIPNYIKHWIHSKNQEWLE